MTALSICLWLVAVVAVNAQYRGPAQEQQQYQPQPQQYQQYQQPASNDYEPRRPLPAIIMHKQALSADGNFKFAFAADNGLQQGETINPDGSRTGSYSYVDPNGKTIKVKYSAGKDGFRVLEGDHLPKAPQPIGPLPGPAPGAEPAPYTAPQGPSLRYSAQAQYRPSPGPAAFPSFEASNQGTTAIFGGQQGRNPYQVKEEYEPAVFRSPAPSFPRAYQQPRPTSSQLSKYEEQEEQRSNEPHSFGGGYSFEFAG